MTNFEAVYQQLMTGDLSVITPEVIKDINDATVAIITTPPAARSNLMYHDTEQIILISNCLYNNTDGNLLPLEDETYDKLQIIYKNAFPNSYKIGAPPVSFGETNENIKEVKMLQRPFGRLEMHRKDMMFQDVLLQPIMYRIGTEIDAPSLDSQRRRNVAHLHPMLAGTLDKCTWVTVEDARRFNPDLIQDDSVNIFERDFLYKNSQYLSSMFGMVIMLKYDGIAIEAECTDEVISARTRGDTSSDKTTDVSAIFKGYKFPNARGLKFDKPIGIQFEAIIDKRNLAEVNRILGKNYVNGRSAISGIIGRLDAPRFREFITLVPVEAEIEGTKDVRLEFLNKFYSTIPCMYQYVCGTYETVLYTVRRFYSEASAMRSYLPFMYDGIVCEFTDPQVVNMLGRKNSVNQYQMAIKFQALSKYTRFLGYTFSVGQNGVIYPILHYNPVTLMGTIHQKTTGHSYARFMELGLRPGDIIEITYRNDVIPYASKPNIPDNAYNPNEPIPFPTTCPVCGAPIEITHKGSAICPNMSCIGRTLARTTAMVSKLGIKDISEERIKALGFTSFTEMMNIDANKCYEVLGEVGNQFIDQINKLMSDPIDDYVIVGALGFTGLAQKSWQSILSVMSLEELLALNDMELFSRLKPVSGIGDATINTIKDERRIFANDLLFICNMPNVKRTTGHTQTYDKRIVMTGLRDDDGKIAQAIHYFNPNVELTDGSVTKKTNLVLIPYDGFDNGPNATSKCKTAKKYGIPRVALGTFMNNIKLYI